MGGRQEHLMENLDLFRFALTEEDGTVRVTVGMSLEDPQNVRISLRKRAKTRVQTMAKPRRQS